MSSLIERYLGLKNNYRNYDTKDAIKRMQAFRGAVRDLKQKGYPVGIELLGSISFGLVEPYSDADLVLIHYCDLHKDSGSCPESCPNLIFEQTEITKALKRRLKDAMFNIEFLDNLNLKYVEHVLETENPVTNECAYRLLYYRTMGRPVNRPLFIKYCDTLEKDEESLSGFLEWSSEALAAYLKTISHRHSFNKYNERIINRGLELPPELKEELTQYLE